MVSNYVLTSWIGVLITKERFHCIIFIDYHQNITINFYIDFYNNYTFIIEYLEFFAYLYFYVILQWRDCNNGFWYVTEALDTGREGGAAGFWNTTNCNWWKLVRQ